ncbi:cytochrome b5-like Heme/Steroid binding domain-containing protein [Colletotrichum orchidophilum]|uniref:Cytochrome b5-like Heme/Steroid binding domain-containing protein n=1 Tax=Colletotrichum orchidophilum TaxID=1209926 RepID=A0A1G4BNN8_9PEZI|nr:cytochrome b5-like Heme/Steroid binding domain-containing protein [Colletotrichum orchidophilum]OHF02928.1 cytochrome b5-like Heme/Steroid binding domain-containing protein [Colletotrichum orchidophilum]
MASWWGIQLPKWNTSQTNFEDDKTPVPKPDISTLDSLFRYEQSQLLWLAGLRLSEALTLQETDAYQPRCLPFGLTGADSSTSSNSGGEEMDKDGDNDLSARSDTSDGVSKMMEALTVARQLSLAPWATSEFVDVDETKWFKIFQRERWASYKHAEDSGLSINIDDDAIWEKLSRTIEIANRILTEAVSHEWLASFLNTDSREIRWNVKGGSRGQPPRTGTIIRVLPVSPESRLSLAEARGFLDSIAEHFFWGFHLRDESSHAAGKTCSFTSKSGKTLWWMTLGLEKLQLSFQSKTFQDPEGRQAMFMTAKVMLHELMHSLSGHLNRSIPKFLTDPCVSGELFYDEEKWAEAGYSWEMSFFGTCVKDYMWSYSNRIAFFGLRAPSPDFCYRSTGQYWSYDDWSLEEPFRESQLGVPAILPCAITTSDFWETHVAKYGYQTLRFTGVCVADYLWERNRDDITRVTRAKVLDPPYSSYKHLDASMAMVARRLKARRMKLRELRPWFKEEYGKWHTTVYAETQQRDNLSLIGTKIESRYDTHEVSIRNLIKTTLLPHDQCTDLAATSPRNTNTSRLFFQALSYLALAALPVRKKPTTYTNQTPRGLYPDRLVKGLRPNFAGGQEVIDLALQYERRKGRATKFLYSSYTPSHDKEMCMSNARLAFLRWKVLGNLSNEMAVAFDLEWRDMRRRMDQSPFDSGWLGFEWQEFPYSHETIHCPIVGSQDEEPLLSDDDDADLPSWAIAKPVIALSPLPARDQPLEVSSRLRYYHVGEIGDHQRIGSRVKWFVHKPDDDDRYLVYDFSGALPDHAWDDATRDKLTMRPDSSSHIQNRMLRAGDIGEETCKRYMKDGPIGQVLPLINAEDIRLNNESNSLACVVFGPDVFDLTDCQLPLEMKDLQFIIESTTEGNPLMEAVNSGYHPDIVVDCLRSYQIGIRWEQTLRGDIKRFRPFTLSEVKWHAYPETGIYTVIQNNVFDLTDFIKHHPGGMRILQEVAGKDGTDAFLRYHEKPTSFRGTTTHHFLNRLRIGQLVREHSPSSQLSAQQIAIRGQIFSKEGDLSKLPSHVQSFLSSKELDIYWGKEVTPLMDTEYPPKVLQRLFKFKSAVVAKTLISRQYLPFMDDKVLKHMDGKVNPWGFNESYVSDGACIYNLTSYLKYEEPDEFVEILKAHAGKTLSDSIENQQVKQRLKTEFKYRIIAQHGLIDDFDWKKSFRPTPSKVPNLKEVGSSMVNPSLTWAQAAQKGKEAMPPNQVVQPIQGMAGKKRKVAMQPPVPKLSRAAPYDSAGGSSTAPEATSTTEQPTDDWEWKVVKRGRWRGRGRR